MQKRKKYAKEFKLIVLRYMNESSKPVAEVAGQLGIVLKLLYK